MKCFKSSSYKKTHTQTPCWCPVISLNLFMFYWFRTLMYSGCYTETEISTNRSRMKAQSTRFCLHCLEQIPAGIGREAGYAPDRSPVHLRADKQFTHSHRRAAWSTLAHSSSISFTNARTFSLVTPPDFCLCNLCTSQLTLNVELSQLHQRQRQLSVEWCRLQTQKPWYFKLLFLRRWAGFIVTVLIHAFVLRLFLLSRWHLKLINLTQSSYKRITNCRAHYE